ncbi:hypothetical protein KR026_002088 [Drosophila bipectinata]|nr:hypothetical protein KR026_002088 [Drosophila bipectinata]
MSGTQITYVTEGPQPPKEVIVVATAPPPEPPKPPNPTVRVTPSRSYFQRNRQILIPLLVFFLLIYGGMDMADSLGWNQSYSLLVTSDFSYSWFIGFIIGALGSSVTMMSISKVAYYVLGGVMELIASIIVTAVPNDNESILAARYLGGVGIGLITVPFLIHNAEVSQINNRGVGAGMEQAGITIGISFQAWFSTEWESVGLSPSLVHGIVGIVFSVVGLLMCLLVVESPVFHLKQSHEEKARQCQKQLNPATATKDLEEIKIYVAESHSRSLLEDLLGSVLPFTKMLFFRCFVAFSVSLPLVRSFVMSSRLAIGYFYAWPMYVWAALRVIGVLVGLMCLDLVGRKAASLVGLLCMAGLMLGLAGIYGNITNWYSMASASNIGLAFQVFAGLYICSTSAYLGEAFPLRLKPFLVGFIVCMEQVVHLIVLACMTTIDSEVYFQYFLAVGIIMVVFLILFAITMPETKRTTLRESGKRFQQLLYIRMI